MAEREAERWDKIDAANKAAGVYDTPEYKASLKRIRENLSKELGIDLTKEHDDE